MVKNIRILFVLITLLLLGFLLFTSRRIDLNPYRIFGHRTLVKSEKPDIVPLRTSSSSYSRESGNPIENNHQLPDNPITSLPGKDSSHHGNEESILPDNRLEASHEGEVPKKRGYILSFRFYEQQTQAVRNFLQFQCLADSYNMRTVQPFVYQSSISFPFPKLSNGEDLLRLCDLIDMDLWNKQTSRNFGFPDVADWEEFLNSAPRNVIINCVKYRNPTKLRIPIPGFNYRNGCPEECFAKFNHSLKFLNVFSFKLVRKVCSNFIDYAGSVAADGFLDNMLGGYRPENVTILMNEFRGFYGLYRLPVLSECGIKHSKVGISVMPSQRIVRDANRYGEQVLGGRPYIAVLARIERVILHLHQDIHSCATQVLEILERLGRTHNITDYFLAMDVGRFGSSGAALHNLLPNGEVLFDSIYNNATTAGTDDGRKWTIEEWEDSFERHSSNDNAAYVANLQRTLAAKGDCLIMIGAGGFQAQARSLYEKYHPDQSARCVYKLCS